MLKVILAAIVTASSVAAALGALYKFLRLGELRRGTTDFLADWNGEKPRPGFEGRLSFPERMTAQEQRTVAIEKRTADLNHDMRGEMTSRLILLEEATAQLRRNGGTSVADAVHRIEAMVDDLKQTVGYNSTAIAQVNQRVSDHGQRNQKQIDILAEDMRRRIADASTTQQQVEAMRAIIHELGLEMDVPHPADG